MMDDEGNLLVNTVGINEKGEEIEGMGVMDVERQDDDFCEFASAYIWPHVRSFSFADPLKSIAMQLFGLTRKQCFGTDEDKNTLTDIIWKDMPGKSRSKKKMTAREFYNLLEPTFAERLNRMFGHRHVLLVYKLVKRN